MLVLNANHPKVAAVPVAALSSAGSNAPLPPFSVAVAAVSGAAGPVVHSPAQSNTDANTPGEAVHAHHGQQQHSQYQYWTVLDHTPAGELINPVVGQQHLGLAPPSHNQLLAAHHQQQQEQQQQLLAPPAHPAHHQSQQQQQHAQQQQQAQLLAGNGPTTSEHHPTHYETTTLYTPPIGKSSE